MRLPTVIILLNIYNRAQYYIRDYILNSKDKDLFLPSKLNAFVGYILRISQYISYNCCCHFFVFIMIFTTLIAHSCQKVIC